MKEIKKKRFTEAGHLNDNSVALYVDAVKLGLINRLPDSIYDHAQDCLSCTTAILQLQDLLSDEDYSEMTSHPYFGELHSKITISDSEDLLDGILNQLRDEAETIPVYERLLEEQVTYRNVYVPLIQVSSPGSEKLYTSHVDFQFATESDKQLTLIVENAQERVLKTTLDPQDANYQLRFDPFDKFPSGLYYWKAALKGGKPILGKFYVFNPRPGAQS